MHTVISPIIIEKTEQLERIVLPLLFLLDNNEIHRYNRLQIALFYLKPHFLPAYKFESQNVWGEADDQIKEDMKFLCGKISCKIIDLENGTYIKYKLTDEGAEDATIYLEEIKEDKVKYDVLLNVVRGLEKHGTERSLTPLSNHLLSFK